VRTPRRPFGTMSLRRRPVGMNERITSVTAYTTLDPSTGAALMDWRTVGRERHRVPWRVELQFEPTLPTSSAPTTPTGRASPEQARTVAVYPTRYADRIGGRGRETPTPTGRRGRERASCNRHATARGYRRP